MFRATIITMSIWLISLCAGSITLESATPLGAAQSKPGARSSTPSPRQKATKHTWHTGPASSPLETEVVPSPPPPAPPLTLTSDDGYANAEKSTRVNRPVAELHRSGQVAPVTSVSLKQAPTAKTDQPANSRDPETQRIADDFDRLRQDSGARTVFYNDLLDMVERVRAGARNENPAEKKLVSHQAAAPSGIPSNRLPRSARPD
jgi:hypothetical protein